MKLQNFSQLLGIVNPCNPNSKVKASLGYIAKPCPKIENYIQLANRLYMRNQCLLWRLAVVSFLQLWKLQADSILYLQMNPKCIGEFSLKC